MNVHISLPVNNASRTKKIEAIIDSGASRCVFHASIGRWIGLDINKGRSEDTNGIAGASRIFLHEISLYIPGGDVRILAGFTDAIPVAGVLGMKGFFEHFRILFDPTAQACELERLYQLST